MKKYYHFTGNKLRDGRPIPQIGTWLVHEESLVPCASGLHASEHPFDALVYAPGPFLHLVELGDCVVPHGDPVDKVVSDRRRILASIDATELLCKFARRMALDVAHLWSCPPAVQEFLETGNSSMAAKSARVAYAAYAAYAAWAATDAAATMRRFCAVSTMRRALVAAAAAAWAAWAAYAATTNAAAAAEVTFKAAKSVRVAYAAYAAWAATDAATATSAWAATDAEEAMAKAKYRQWFLEMVEEVFSRNQNDARGESKSS